MDELDELFAQWVRLDNAGDTHSGVSAAQHEEYAREMESLDDAAGEFYTLDQLDSAIPLYRKAYEIAVKARDEERQVKYKEWEGHCLQRMGRLWEGLACLLELERLQANPPDHWMGLIFQITTAIQIPISLHKIEALIRRCRDEMERSGLRGSRSMLLMEESFLAYYRHDFSAELAKTQEAMSAHEKGAYPKYNIHAHYYQLIDAFLDMGDRPNAERWLAEYEGVETQFEVSKELRILSFKRRLALMDGDYKAAWDYARRHLSKSREAQDSPYIGLRDFGETAIECGHLTEAGRALWELLSKHRNSENGHRRYEIRRLAGDYHRAMAQRAAVHMDECGQQTATFRKYEKAFRKHTAMARRDYGYALKTGQFLDERLCCDWHEKEMRQRIRSLE